MDLAKANEEVTREAVANTLHALWFRSVTISAADRRIFRAFLENMTKHAPREQQSLYRTLISDFDF